jgi:hypothetical protein
MRARKAPLSGQAELFRARLENLIDHSHDLVTLAERIDWAMFESKFGVQFTEGSGRPALPTRLMVGLQYLKYLYNCVFRRSRATIPDGSRALIPKDHGHEIRRIAAAASSERSDASSLHQDVAPC